MFSSMAWARGGRGYSDVRYFYIYCFGTPLKSSSRRRGQKSVVRIC